MIKKEKLILIDGSFDVKEAQDILVNVFNSKINFHVLKNLKEHEKSNKDDETAMKRIPELKKSIEYLLEILEEAKKENKKLLVCSEINIQLID